MENSKEHRITSKKDICSNDKSKATSYYEIKK